jgi:hypothetical protein
MLRDVLIMVSCGAAGYAWLCAIASPLVAAVRSFVHRATRQAAMAMALAIGAGVLWTAIAAAAIVLAMILEPRAGLVLLGSHLFWPGVAAGCAAWLLQLALTLHVPRFGATFEAATALAVVAVVNDDPRTLARVHGIYAAHALADGARDAASHAVCEAAA